MKKPKPLAKSFDEMTRIYRGAIPKTVGCAFCDAGMPYGTAATFDGGFCCLTCYRRKSLERDNAAFAGKTDAPLGQDFTSVTAAPQPGGGYEIVTHDPAPAHPRKVAIVGFSDTSRDLAPYDDPSFEIWSLGWQMRRAKRLTRGFEIHTEEFLRRVHGDGWPEYQAFLKAMTVPLYMQTGQPYDSPPWSVITGVEYPAAIRFPIERATKACFGTDDPFSGSRPLWTNSIQFMLALAGIEGFQEVHIFGVDMAHRLEYVHQRHGVTLLIGMLMGMGVHVSVPEHCALLHSDHVYGYEEEPYGILTEVEMHLRKDREMRLAQHEAHLAKAQSLAGYTEAQKDMIEYVAERARGGRAEKPIPAEFMR